MIPYTREQAMGQDRHPVSKIDELRATQFITDLLSGADNYTSGQTLWTVTASNIVRNRPRNIHMHNRETSHVTIVFRDGGITGSIIAGPYIVNPIQAKPIGEDELEGRYFTSSILAIVISGPTYAQGVDINLGYLLEPDPTDPGGYLE